MSSDNSQRREVGTAVAVSREQEVTLYELFLRQPEGGYRRFVRWEGQDEWIPTDGNHPKPPYQVLPL